MRKSVAVLFIALLGCFQLNAQTFTGLKGTVNLGAVANFMELAALPIDSSQFFKSMPEELEEGMPDELSIPPGSTIYLQEDDSGTNGSIPANIPTALTPTPTADFQGLLDNIASIPPDVHGGVGPNHLMVTHNSQVRVMSKTGSTISTVSLDNFWSPLGSPSTFDPKVRYDPYSSRWMFTACGDAAAASSALLVAVSETDDPTGNWYMYSIDADATDVNWFDYPSIGFNKDWIVITGNMFPISSGSFYGKVWVLDKADFYAGTTADFTEIDAGSSGGTICPAVTYDNTTSTMYMVKNWNGNAGGFGYVRMYTITGAIGSEVLTAGAFASTSDTWSFLQSNGEAMGPQSGSTDKITLNDSRMQDVVYRDGSIWCTHTVFLPASSPTRSSVQWWELNTSGSVIQRSRIDDSTGDTFYAYPSIAVNANGDAVIGYSSFSLTQFASANYSYRYSCDATNTFGTDHLYKAGEAKYYKTYSGDRNRWGDYTVTCIDPTNDIDFWTLQEYAATPITFGSTTYDRWATWWAKIVPPDDGGAGTWTWTGAIDTDWFSRCNWDQYSLPDLSSDVVIPGSLSNYPLIQSGTAECKSISVDYSNGASVTVDIPNGGALNSNPD